MMHEVLALRGMKASYVATMLHEGLTRPSSGWFVQPEPSDWSLATWATAVWMGIGRSVRSTGHLTTEANSYASYFAKHPEHTPAIVLFRAPKDPQNLRHYYWRGSIGNGVTQCYARLDRSGASAPLQIGRASVLYLTPNDLADIEERAAGASRPHPQSGLWLGDTGVPGSSGSPESSPEGDDTGAGADGEDAALAVAHAPSPGGHAPLVVATKLAHFCALAGQSLWGRSHSTVPVD